MQPRLQEGIAMLDSEQAFRIFLLTGLPQAYTYSRAARRREGEGPTTPQRS